MRSSPRHVDHVDDSEAQDAAVEQEEDRVKLTLHVRFSQKLKAFSL